MQHIHLRHVPHQFQHTATPSKTRRFDMGLSLITVTLLAAIMFLVMSHFGNYLVWLPDLEPTAPESTARVANDNPDNPIRKDSLSVFVQNAQTLAATGTRGSFRELVQTLKQSEPATHRAITINLLKGAPEPVVPILIDALYDSDAGVRAGAVQVLGMRREYQAIDALVMATHDPKASVRSNAARSLAEINAWQELPRLELLQIIDGNANVQDAANSAVSMIKAQIAKEMGLQNSQWLDVTVTASDLPQLYVATQSDLYTRRGTDWQLISALPDTPLDLATADGKMIYLATANSGLYRSSDGGVTWEYVQFGLHTPTKLTVTAIVVDMRNPELLYIALASPGNQPGKLDTLGVSVSIDGGKTCYQLENSPMNAVTTRLFVDPDMQGFLYGLTDDTPWRYKLPSEF